ncbi:unnamed protein product [Acanthoscelides obtectus]|uniref:Uncharacterized protein n=1 Tax=Acanthoscelides obtectus TaxID=200917 RepID=A0A9P0PK07_ACAOB|nr:unnamed protein product [Acanthoscelides obtectus]CAK1654567.1 hypothetical protein AOBTE_LOCUS18680 [Acanthoscelides obtectus]
MTCTSRGTFSGSSGGRSSRLFGLLISRRMLW